MTKKNQQLLLCEVRTDSGQTVENSIGHSDTEATDGTLCVTERLWTDFRRPQWTKGHNTKGQYSVTYREIVENGRRQQ